MHFPMSISCLHFWLLLGGLRFNYHQIMLRRAFRATCTATTVDQKKINLINIIYELYRFSFMIVFFSCARNMFAFEKYSVDAFFMVVTEHAYHAKWKPFASYANGIHMFMLSWTMFYKLDGTVFTHDTISTRNIRQKLVWLCMYLMKRRRNISSFPFYFIFKFNAQTMWRWYVWKM